MGSSGPAVLKVFSVVTAIFGIGVIAVSGALLHQAIKYRDYYFYGSAYGGGGSYYGGGGGGYFGGGSQYFGGGQYGYGSGYDGDYGAYDPYRYHKVIAIAAVALGVGLIQFFVSLVLCCTNDQNSKPLAIGYIIGSVFVLLVTIVCFGLGFQYRIIYPYYFYNVYRANYYYTEYNPEGQAFSAILGIDIIYLIISSIMVAVFAKRSEWDEPVEWHVRPNTSSTLPAHDYGRDGLRTA